MQEVDINTLCESYQILGKNVPNDIIIVGKIDKLIIDYMYDFLDLSKVKCKKIIYCDQNGESIKNHILPNSLKFLECGENNLTSLPDNLPDSIEILSCGSFLESSDSISAASSTVRVKNPIVSREWDTGTTPYLLIKPNVGFIPHTPTYDAGRSTEPAVCEPRAAGNI